MRRVVLCVASAALLVAGCSGDDDIDPVDAVETDDDVDQPEQDEPEPEPEEADDDPFAVPDEIDEDYLQRVADEIMAIRTDILRDTVEANPETDRLSEDIRLRLDSIYSGPTLVSAVDTFADYVRAENLDELFLPSSEIEDQELKIFEVVDADRGCAIAIGRYDFTPAQVPNDSEEATFVLVFEHREESSNAESTVGGWRLFDNGRLIDLDTDELLTPDEVVGLPLETYEGLVDTSCGAAE